METKDEILKNENEVSKSSRQISLDIIRIVAMLLVVMVHSYHKGYGSYYNNTSFSILVISFIRWICMNCVPLFIVLSGFLLSKKEPSKTYYKKIIRILVEYTICSIICSLFKYNESTTFLSIIADIFSFQGAPYSWYVNMYIGLFLIIPFFKYVL